VPETLTLKVALKRNAIANMDTLELQALAYFCKRLFKDLRFPWKRITTANLSMSYGEDTPQVRVPTPGIRFGSLFVHQQRYDPALYAVSHYATGQQISSAGSLQEAAYLCGALEFGGIPWDLIEDLAGWMRVRNLPIVNIALANIRRASALADDNQSIAHEHTPLARLAQLVQQADALRAVLEISQPNQILFLDGIHGGDTTIVVTADGLGGATYEEFDDYNAGLDNRQQLKHVRFSGEREAVEFAREKVEDPEDDGIPIGNAVSASNGVAVVTADFEPPV
jgi:hypothetical protein